MATVSQGRQPDLGVRILRGIKYRDYVRLATQDAYQRFRLAYHNGTLAIMSPRLHRHERPSRRINLIIEVVARVLNIPHEGVGQSTFHLPGDGPRKGTGREADQSYYFRSVDRLPQDREPDLDAGDPPPDLWVEVDNRATSIPRLPAYAHLGILEIWRYDAETGKNQFLGFAQGVYTDLECSIALPFLTPERVEFALANGQGQIESEWVNWLRGGADQFRQNVEE